MSGSTDCSGPDPEGWDLLNTCDGFPDDWVVDVAADGDDLWVAFPRAISHYDGTTWTHYTLNYNLSQADIHSITVSDGTVYFATYEGLGRLEDRILKIVDGGNGPSQRIGVRSLEPGSWGERPGWWGPDEGAGVWYTAVSGGVGTTGEGLHFYNTVTDRIITVDDVGLVPVSVLQSNADQLWLKRPSKGIEEWGRREYYGDRWFNNAEYARNNINLCLENATSLATGTYGPPGAEVRFLLAPYEENEFGDCDLTSSRVAADAAATRPRMARYDGSTWTSSRMTSARRTARIGASMTELEGPYRQVLVTPYGRIPLGAPEREWSIESEWWGTTWVVGANGVAYSVHVNYDEDEWQDDGAWAEWTLLSAATGDLPDGGITSMAYTEDGRVWIGTSAGLAVYTLVGEPIRAAVSAPGPEGWHMLAAPVGGASVGGLLGPVWTQGFPGADAPHGGPTALLYDEAAPCDADPGTAVPPCDASTGFVVPSSNAHALPSGTGLFAYLFADDDPTTGGIQGGFPKALAVTGHPPALPFAFPTLSYTDTGSPAADGWNLVGNPLPGSLDWDASGWTKTALSNVVYVYDPAAAEYRTWNGTVGTLGGGLIPMGHGFWVQATAPNPALVAPKAADATATASGISPEARVGAASAEVLELRLTGTTAAGTRGSSLFVALGIEGSALGADAYDAFALVPPSGSYILASAAWTGDGEALATAALPTDALDSSGLDLKVGAAHAGLVSGQLTWTWTLPEAVGWSATLVDTETGAEVDLSTASEYTFAVDAQNKQVSGDIPLLQMVPLPDRAARLADGRFLLRLSRLSVGAAPSAPTAFAVEAPSPNPVRLGAQVRYTLPQVSDVEVAVYDLLGRRLAKVEAAGQEPGYHTAEIEAGSLAAGVYVVRMEVRPFGGEARLFVHKMTVVR